MVSGRWKSENGEEKGKGKREGLKLDCLGKMVKKRKIDTFLNEEREDGKRGVRVGLLCSRGKDNYLGIKKKLIYNNLRITTSKFEDFLNYSRKIFL